MKRTIFPTSLTVILYLCVAPLWTYSQAARNVIKPAYIYEPLNVGDPFPDIPLGEVLNNNTGKTKFSQFKGQLVILDFWNIHCAVCLQLMPHIERLQKEFGDSIQVILVNTTDTKEQVLNFMKNSKWRLPNLPCIVNAKVLDQLFPTPMGQPHHVWIDKAGIIRVRGSNLNTYESNVRDFLYQKKIFSMKDDNSSANFDEHTAYYKSLSNKGYPLMDYGSFFTLYNNELAALSGGKVKNIRDSSTDVIRNTFINQDVLELYEEVFKEELANSRKDKIYDSRDYRSCGKPARFSLLVKDTIRFTPDFIEFIELTEKEFTQSKYCYEQITPVSFSEKRRKAIMLEDLNRYFGSLLGIEGKLANVSTTCYFLRRTSDKDKVSTSSKTKEYQITSINEGGRKMTKYVNRPLSETIREVLTGKFIKGLKEEPVVVFDQTGIRDNIDIILPDRDFFVNLDELQRALEPYDLKLVKEQAEIKMIVISENKVDKE